MACVLSDIFEFCSTEIVSIPEWEAKAVYGEVSDKKSLQMPTSQWHHTLMKHKGVFYMVELLHGLKLLLVLLTLYFHFLDIHMPYLSYSLQGCRRAHNS